MPLCSPGSYAPDSISELTVNWNDSLVAIFEANLKPNWRASGSGLVVKKNTLFLGWND